MTNMNTAINAADALVNKSDRWLFLFFAALLLIFGAVVLKYFMDANKELVTQLQKEQQEHEEAMKMIIAKQNETNLALALALDHNTTALKDTSTQLALCREANKKG